MSVHQCGAALCVCVYTSMNVLECVVFERVCVCECIEYECVCVCVCVSEYEYD